MAVYKIFKYGKRFRFAPSFNKYKSMYFDRNISENKDGKKMRAVICLV